MSPHELVEHFGGVNAAARALRIKPPSVCEWVNKGVVPVGRQCQAELVSGGKLRADRELLGDVDSSPEERAA